MIQQILYDLDIHVPKLKDVLPYSVDSSLYHGLATFTEVKFVNVHQAQMSTFVIEVCLWYIGFVLVFNSLLHY